MRHTKQLLYPAALLACLLMACGLLAETNRVYYAIEIDGVLCGYSEIEISHMEEDGRDLIVLEQEMFLNVKALGAEIKSEVDLTYQIDPVTGQFIYHDSEIKQGQIELSSRVYIEGEVARSVYGPDDEKIVNLPPGVILENTLMYSHLVRDFVLGDLTEKSYEVFDVREGEVQTITYTRTGMEDLTLSGEAYKAVAFDVQAEKTGLKYQIWIDSATGYLLQSKVGKRASYRTDASVKKRIEVGDADELIFADVNILIPDIHSISYMKVRAKMEPSGLRITPEALNVPGQRFTGTVVDNLIDGVFEIEHKHYDGMGAPPFPPDFGDYPDLGEFLKPDGFIESDDPVLAEKAREVTDGALDSWEAATRLSEWVGKNIGYALPGGGSARKTYDIRAGECGAHSFLLAAFCRSVGIPARVVWGCMYVSNRGGAFGQHAWNEIYMGDAGWIPVDATVMETKFVDSGHIRFGTYQSLTTSFNPIAMEVLDYRVGPDVTEAEEGGVDFGPYLGEYRGPKGTDVRVFVQDGTLTMNIKGQVTLPFSEPDEEGIWRCKLTDRLFAVFEENGDGEVTGMELHEIVTMPRQSDLDEVADDTPQDLRRYLGNYLFAQLQAEFKVFCRDGGLAIRDPLENATIRLRPPDENGRWVDEFDKYTVTFDLDANGEVTAMNLDAPTEFARR